MSLIVTHVAFLDDDPVPHVRDLSGSDPAMVIRVSADVPFILTKSFLDTETVYRV